MEGPPWGRPEPERLSHLLQDWREGEGNTVAPLPLAAVARPPPFPLGGAELARLVGHG